MRALFLLLLILAAGFSLKPAQAAPRWCAITYEGASNCSFDTMDGCRAATAGTGGFCMPEAPVGHRQPTSSGAAAPLPKDDLDRQIEEMNRKLDRSLEICRGCSNGAEPSVKAGSPRKGRKAGSRRSQPR